MELKKALTEGPPYFCHLCDKSYAWSECLKYHIRHKHKICVCLVTHKDIEECYRQTVHKKKIDHYYCDLCDRIIKSKLNKAYHDISKPHLWNILKHKINSGELQLPKSASLLFVGSVPAEDEYN